LSRIQWKIKDNATTFVGSILLIVKVIYSLIHSAVLTFEYKFQIVLTFEYKFQIDTKSHM